MQSSIQVGVNGPAVWVKVEGKGSFLNSGNFKEFARQMVERGYREFVVDLDKCAMLDSTFMGTMAGVALRLKELGRAICVSCIVANAAMNCFPDWVSISYFQIQVERRSRAAMRAAQRRDPRPRRPRKRNRSRKKKCSMLMKLSVKRLRKIFPGSKTFLNI